MTQLRRDGYELVPTYDEADIVVVNTCGFIDSAKAESLQSIGEAINENGKVIVTGCLGAQEASIRDHYPQVLSVTGPHQYDEVVAAVHQFAPIDREHNPYLDLLPEQGIKLTPAHYAYVKISEGCNHHCTFCIIPSMRGRLKSRVVDSVYLEAERLVDNGVRELLIVSQDTSAYGSDLKYPQRPLNGNTATTSLAGLCEALSRLDAWVRLHYVYPYPHVDDIIGLMSHDHVLPYLDIPFQHGSPRILKAMRRPAASENNLQRIQRWREQCPDLTIRSTFIVGFPGETDEDFEQLLEFVQHAELDRVGCFQYSPVDGAAANEIAQAVPEAIKQARWERFMATQQEISQRRLTAKRGRQFDVLIDEVSTDRIVGRSYADAPEIDGVVYLEIDSDVSVGDKAKVVIEDSDEYDLFARLV